MTHGHELSWGVGRGMLVGQGGAGRRGIKGRKKRDNTNSIINKVYFKKNKKYLNMNLKVLPYSPTLLLLRM